MINFDLPKKLIAQTPASPRDSAKLLVYDRKSKIITDTVFKDLQSFLPHGSMLVLNNSKVENCRWLFGDMEIFVLNKLDMNTIRALVRPGKKFKLGAQVSLAPGISAHVASVDEDGHRTLRLSTPHDDPQLKKYEHVPLPPYIAQNDELAKEYQTVYAKPLGSKAAPTAGLHFTEELLQKISKSHEIAEVTLHVGLGTFASPTSEQIAIKHLHAEHYDVDRKTWQKIATSGHVTAVGTTSARVLESIARTGKTTGSTDIFIQPGDKFQRVNSLITNFHLPGTSLLMLIEAFVGSASETKRIYDHAIAEQYRFYSFGDAMLLL